MTPEAYQAAFNCQQIYSKPFLSTLLSRIGNAFLSLIGQSDWQKARKALQEKTAAKLQERLFSDIPLKDLSERAQVCSEYILRALTQPGATQAHASTISLETIIDRAPFGNGKTLPDLNRDLILLKIEKLRDQYAATVATLDKRIANAETVTSQLSRQVTELQQKTALLFNEPCTREQSFLEKVKNVHKAAHTMLNAINQVLERENCVSDIALSSRLTQFRENKKELSAIVQNLSRPV